MLENPYKLLLDVSVESLRQNIACRVFKMNTISVQGYKPRSKGNIFIKRTNMKIYMSQVSTPVLNCSKNSIIVFTENVTFWILDLHTSLVHAVPVGFEKPQLNHCMSLSLRCCVGAWLRCVACHCALYRQPLLRLPPHWVLVGVRHCPAVLVL